MVRKLLLRLLLPLAVFVAVLEGIGYGLRREVPVPDRATRLLNEQFYEYDRELIVRLRKNADFNYRSVRAEIDARMTTNSQGFRGADFTAADADAFRIAVFGDSVTFGLGVPDGADWPSQLVERLHRAAGGKRIQLRNYAVPGYSTFQGRVLFERHVGAGDFRPDLAICAFGFNDGYLRVSGDEAARDTQRALRESAIAGAVRWLRDRSWFISLVLGGTPESTKLRVPPAKLHDNLTAMAGIAKRRGVPVLWIDACLPYTYARRAMRAVADANAHPFIAFRSLFRARNAISNAEGHWPEGGELKISFDTRGIPVPASPDDRPPLYAVFLADAAQRETPRAVSLLDDGKRGDARAGDGIWTGRVDIDATAAPELAIAVPGLQARSDRETLLATHLLQPGPGLPREPDGARHLAIDVAALASTPWPGLVLHPDHIHANPTGCKALADGVAAVVQNMTVFREFIQ